MTAQCKEINYSKRCQISCARNYADSYGNKEKETYYNALRAYDNLHNAKPMIRVVELAILESLHKRLAYLDGLQIVPLTEYAQTQKRSFQSLLNSSRRQTIPAFREKGVWKIGIKKHV